MARKKPAIAEDFEHFNSLATLLSLNDPVRGSPTVHSLERHPNDSSSPYKYLERFLDSFALVCSTGSKGGETASAVCLEQNHLAGSNVLRLARNCGVPQDLVDRLDLVLDKLRFIARRGQSTPELEDEILSQILELTQEKVKSLLEWLSKPEVRQSVKAIMEKIQHSNSSAGGVDGTGFGRWIRNLPGMVSLPEHATSLTLLPYVRWASRARWRYSKQLESLLGFQLPQWIISVYKLGRYHAATKAMIRLALNRPALFQSIRIEVVESLPSKTCKPEDGRPLLKLLQRLDPTANHDQLMSELGKHWSEGMLDSPRLDPEDHFRKKCKHHLTLHAEMQLLAFYDQNPRLAPDLLFMGTSKKACYLCHQVLSLHPLRMIVSASHQKIYRTWMPLHLSGSGQLAERYRTILRGVKLEMERAVMRELQGELGRRRPANLDSTAGPPITFASTFSTMRWPEQ